MLKYMFILSFCFMGVYCGVSGERTTVTAAEKAKGYACKSSNSNLGLMRDGEVKTNFMPNSCIQATCNSDGIISRLTCGVGRGPPECKLVSDYTRPYPECCPQIVCN